MKKILTSALALLTATAAYAADEVRLQLQWVTQAQFAGYYVALDKGYYDAEDLDVSILDTVLGWALPIHRLGTNTPKGTTVFWSINTDNPTIQGPMAFSPDSSRETS